MTAIAKFGYSCLCYTIISTSSLLLVIVVFMAIIHISGTARKTEIRANVNVHQKTEISANVNVHQKRFKRKCN